MNFLHGRTSEIRTLESSFERARAGEPQLVVLFGRRRVGKTFLLQHVLNRLADAAEGVYHACSYLAISGELASIWNGLRSTGRVPSDEPPPIDIDSFLDAMARLSEDRLLVVMLDEAPYLIETSDRVPAAIQRFWDRLATTGRRCKLVIVLTGSAVSTMTTVISSGGPLFGRPTEVIRLDPFDLPTSASFMNINEDSPPNQLAALIEARAACDGYPLLLRQWDVSKTAPENLANLAIDPFSPLVNMASVLLLDLPDDRGLRSSLTAIGRGVHKHSEIQNLADQRVDAALSTLQAGGFVVAHVSIDDTAQRSSRRRLFRIGDAHLRFYFGMIEPYRQLIEAGQGNAVLTASTQRWAGLVANTFEIEARAHATRMVRDGQLPNGLLIGEWWTDRPQQAQIDVVACNGSSGEWIVVGEAKWTNRFSGNEIRNFERNLSCAGAKVGAAKRMVWVGSRDVVDIPISDELRVYDVGDLIR
jgi:uncharacterized protein